VRPAAKFAKGLFRVASNGDMAAMNTRADRITARLTEAFAPTLLRVLDESARHAGHAGARPGGETHYAVLLVSPAFQGQSRVARSRAVHAALESEFATGLHALGLTLRTPPEQQAADAVPPRAER
jgi:BolA family transcriptional regulator, general stress-responsive regulator